MHERVTRCGVMRGQEIRHMLFVVFAGADCGVVGARFCFRIPRVAQPSVFRKPIER